MHRLSVTEMLGLPVRSLTTKKTHQLFSRPKASWRSAMHGLALNKARSLLNELSSGNSLESHGLLQVTLLARQIQLSPPLRPHSMGILTITSPIYIT